MPITTTPSGGQSYDTGANKNGAAGGSGLIIVRYPLS
jgi:hypothetical protein